MSVSDSFVPSVSSHCLVIPSMIPVKCSIDAPRPSTHINLDTSWFISQSVFFFNKYDNGAKDTVSLLFIVWV